MSNSRPGVETVIVAAGISRRMGAANKLLLPIGGVPMVRHVVMRHRAVADHVIVVTGHDRDAVVEALAGLDVVLVHNPDFAEGQARSVAAGVSSAPLDGRALIVALGDQPLLQTEDIAFLIDGFDGDGGERICIPVHAGQRGNPVIFPAALARTMRHDGKSPGCRRFIDAHPELVYWLPASNDHFTTDVDTPEDARRILGVPVPTA